MALRIGIRREDKNIWEKRVPLIPEHIKKLKDENGIQTVIQSYPNRAFTDSDYVAAGAAVKEDLSECPVVFAVKEVPIKLLKENTTYIFFSHTIKGQDYNMPLLQKLLDLKCTLIDYETIKDANGRRVVFFGRYAGYAGMIDTLHGMGKRYLYLGKNTPFTKVKPAYEYKDLNEAKLHLKLISDELRESSLVEMPHLVVGFAGYGNVSQGAQEIFDILPFTEISAKQLASGEYEKVGLVKVVFREEDMVEPVDESKDFDLQEYYSKPENYKSNFEQYLDKMDALINAIFWNENYPRFITKEYLKNNADNLRLQVIGDITCDIDGAVEITYKATDSDNPAFVYDPETDQFTDGYEGKGLVDITVDNLPAEMPRDSSVGFSKALAPFVPGIVNADYNSSFADVKLPEEIKRAVVVYNGELTPNYKYLEEFLK